MNSETIKEVKKELLEKDFNELKEIMEKHTAGVTVINNEDRTFHISTSMDINDLRNIINDSISKWLGHKTTVRVGMLYNLMKMTQTDYLLMI